MNPKLLASLIVVFSFLVLTGNVCMAQESATPTKEIEQEPSDQSPKQTSAEIRREKAKEAFRLVVQANQLHDTGEYSQAYKTISQACELEPENYSNQLTRGGICFSAGKMTECVAAYDKVIELQPTLEPQLWQRGLALYYADEFADGVKQFETHQTVNSQDVENAVWHLLCASRVSDVGAARKKLIPITGDPRVPMSQIYEMFAGRMTPEEVMKQASKTSSRVTNGSAQHQLQLYYAHLYTGLYYEMLQDKTAALDSLKKAETVNPLGKSNFMGQVARVHLNIRAADKTTDGE